MIAEQFLGYRICKIRYRGKDIFTIYVEKDKKELGINFVDCFQLIDKGVIGKTITDFDISPLGTSARFITQKYKLNPEDYESFWFKAIDEDDNEGELMVEAKLIEVNEDIHLYNPISDDKYPDQPSIEELRKKKD